MKKHLFLSWGTAVVCLLANLAIVSAQENPDVTKQLETKYKLVTFHDHDGGWYSVISTGTYGDKGNHGACDLQGNEIIPPIYDDVHFQGSHYTIEKDGKTAIRDLNNKELLPFKYETVRWYQIADYGYCEVILNGKSGVVDKQGHEVIPCKYDEVKVFNLKDQDFCNVKLNGLTGVVDKKGQIIIPCKYEDINSWELEEGNYCQVKLNGEAGAADRTGTLVVPCKYDFVYTYCFKQSNFCMVKTNELYGAASLQGEEILPCKYTYLSTKGDYIIACLGGDIPTDGFWPVGGKWGLYNGKTKKQIVPFTYTYICLPQEGLAAFNTGGIVWSNNKTWQCGCKNGKWGYLDVTTGKEVIPAQYESAQAFKDGVAQVTKDGVTSILTNPLTGTQLAVGSGSSVDTDIPVTGQTDDTKFAFIVANESYYDQVASYASHDGKIFKDYCEKRLGIPAENIRFYENATYGNFVSMVQRMKDIAEAYEGDATIFFYYTGLGATHNQTRGAYLLPVDAVPTSLESTAYSLDKLYMELAQMPTRHTVVLLDAGFAGTDKDGKAMGQSRGISIKPKKAAPAGNVVIFQATSGEGTAYASKDCQHGLFTHALLKQLQQHKTGATLGQLVEAVTNEVKKESLRTFKEVQAPELFASPAQQETWTSIKL